MKTHIIYLFILLLIFISCKKDKKDIYQQKDCISEYVWINYVGITNKIKNFTLIRSCVKDTSYYNIYREDWPTFFYDKDFFNTHCNNLIIDRTSFERIKEYIKSNNTYKQENSINTNSYTAIKICFADKKDSLVYIVNNENSDFFENMKYSIKIKDDHLVNTLKYYSSILNSTNN